MTPEQILSIKPRFLEQSAREFYFREGYILLERVIGEEWLAKLRGATEEMIERSRKISDSDKVFDLEPGHSSIAPRLRRVSNPVEHHPLFWDYVNHSPIVDIVVDLLGPDVKFHHSKLNFKWARGGEEVKWHYDISFWPHTNYSPLTVGTYIYDCNLDNGPLMVLPKSHVEVEPLLTQFDEAGQWIGCIRDADAARLPLDRALALPGPAGSLTIHNCRTLHASPKNLSDTGRPLLLYTLTSADAFPYTVNPIQPKHDQIMIAGKRATWSHHDPRPCLLPPDWSGGYTSIFALQQKEGPAAGASTGTAR